VSGIKKRQKRYMKMAGSNILNTLKRLLAIGLAVILLNGVGITETAPDMEASNRLHPSDFQAFKETRGYMKYMISYFVTKPGDGKSNRVFVGQDAGHAFVRLTKLDLKTFEKDSLSFGFYPDFHYWPILRERGPSAIRRNEFNRFDYKRTYSLNQNQFKAILDFAASKALNSDYDLQDYNCTDFVIQLSELTENPLPDTQRSWPFGEGSTPVALAEDIASLNNGNRFD